MNFLMFLFSLFAVVFALFTNMNYDDKYYNSLHPVRNKIVYSFSYCLTAISVFGAVYFGCLTIANFAVLCYSAFLNLVN